MGAADHTGRFTGTGESFVFTVAPRVATYAWTGKNSEFVLSRADMIAFGMRRNFALTLDARLEFGSSDASETYGIPRWRAGHASRPLIASFGRLRQRGDAQWGSRGVAAGTEVESREEGMKKNRISRLVLFVFGFSVIYTV